MSENYQLSPYERYRADPQFKALVDQMVACLLRADFTTEDIRAASVVASVVFLHQTHVPMTVPREVGKGLDEAEKWIRQRALKDE